MSHERFAFGRNWAAYLRHLNPDRIDAARQSLQQLLDVERLDGKHFLDAGCGSGVFSLAAAALGAKVHSFDYDTDSVRCTAQLRETYAAASADWRVEQGSVLDESYLRSMGPFDVIYSWGVLHHTGHLAKAMENIMLPLRPGGILCVALYNDQGWISGYWRAVKKLYTRFRFARPLLAAFHAPYLLAARFLARRLRGEQLSGRGMSLYHDMIDWLGGYPFETSRPDDVLSFYEKRGLQCRRVQACGRRHGCNEFVFIKPISTGSTI